MEIDKDRWKELDVKKGLLALVTLLLPCFIISLVLVRPVETSPDHFELVRGVFPQHPLATIACLTSLWLCLAWLFPNKAQKFIKLMSSPGALKGSFIISLALTTVAAIGFFHAVAAASTRVENEAGSWYEGINIFVGTVGLIIQTILTYSLYLLTKEQTRQSINQSAAAASTNTMTFTVTLAGLLLNDGIPDPRRSISDALEGLFVAALNGIRMGSSNDLHAVLVQLLKNNLTSPLILIGNSNTIVSDKEGRPLCCRCTAPGNPQIVQIINLGDSIVSRELDGLSLEGQVLDKFDFWGAVLKNFSLRNCLLRKVYLIRGTFINVDFRGADLTGAVIKPTDADRAVAVAYALQTLEDEKLLPIFTENCQFQGATMDRELYDYLCGILGENAPTLLRDVKVNAP